MYQRGLNLAEAARQQRVWSPARLFAGSAQGSQLTITPGLLFQDNAGTIPATAPGQPVGLVRRAAGTVDAAQAVSAARPTLGRHPRGGLRNLARGAQSVSVPTGLWRDSFSSRNYIGTKVGSGFEDGIPYVDYRLTGTKNADSLSYINLTNSNDTVQPGVVPYIPAKTGDTVNGRFTARLIAGTVPAYVQGLRLVVTERTSTTLHSTGNYVNSTVDAVATREKTTVQADVTGMSCYIQWSVAQGSMAIGESFDLTYRIKGLQFEQGLVATAFQHNFGAYDVTEAGVQDLWYLWADGIDDYLVTTAILWASDEMTVVFATHKASDAAEGRLLQYELPTTNGSWSVNLPGDAQAARRLGNAMSRGTVNAVTGISEAQAQYAAPLTMVGSVQGKIGSDTLILRANGTEVARAVTDQGSGVYGSFPLSVFRTPGGSAPFSGRLYGLLVINRLLPPTELVLAERWMAQKYGVILP